MRNATVAVGWALFGLVAGVVIGTHVTNRVVSADLDNHYRESMQRYYDDEAAIFALHLTFALDGDYPAILARNCIFLRQYLGNRRSELQPSVRAQYQALVDAAVSTGGCTVSAAK